MRWIGAQGLELPPPSRAEPLPLAMLEAPCLMRDAAIAALERARVPWRLAFTSASLAGVWTAVGAGLGVTVRTAIDLPPRLQVLRGLPALPQVGLAVHGVDAEPSPVVQRLEQLLTERLAEVVARAAAAP
jgi:DNA-binding transcriptional LysR family regulator